LSNALHVTPLGDRAVLIHLGDAIDEAIHRRVRAVSARLAARPVPGTIEVVPAFASVAVHYDPARVPNGQPDSAPYVRFAAAIEAAVANLGEESLPAPRSVDIPVCYGDRYGPDLGEVAERHGLGPDEVVRLHSAATYRVYMLGFAPGFAYLGGLPDAIATPRRPEPRTAVPAGSVGIGGNQTGIYPLVSPGGWQLIGRTPLRLFDASRSSPTLLAVGDVVTFRPIAPNDFAGLAAPA
jgi:inhibitor of KinA